jgi:hypothetical protein
MFAVSSARHNIITCVGRLTNVVNVLRKKETHCKERQQIYG